MRKIYEELFEGMESSGTLLKREDFREDDGKAGDLEDELDAEMPEEMREKFREFMSLRGAKDREMDQIIFMKGMKMGMQLMLDAIIEREKKRS